MMENLEQLTAWITSEDGFEQAILDLQCESIRMGFPTGVVTKNAVDETLQFDWPRLLLAGSILAKSSLREHLEQSLLIAQSAILLGEKTSIRDSGASILSQLFNARGIELAVKKEHISPELDGRVGVMESLLMARRTLDSSIVINDNVSLQGNPFQLKFWDSLENASWVSATAPTAAGKTFLILNWLLKRFETGVFQLGVFVAPTRALVTEIERDIFMMRDSFGMSKLRVTSLPLKTHASREEPTLLVLTQERLHLFLNSFRGSVNIDVLCIDEAQKLNDGSRGVILQTAIERVVRASPKTKVIFLSPHSRNPELLLEDAPTSLVSQSVPGGASTVVQNLIAAKRVNRKPLTFALSLVGEDNFEPIGTVDVQYPPGSSSLKKLSALALALGRNTTGTLVYIDGQSYAEKIANQIFDGLEDDFPSGSPIDEDLKVLSDYCKSAIHPQFQLVSLVRRGVAFHYGNMPALLRGEIERLFRIGTIRFLVCTSTLIEGVNLACRTILIRGLKKGSKPMLPQDFWNLAGRAGRWGADFQGNIVCIDAQDDTVWPTGVPQRTSYELERATDRTLRNADAMQNFIVSEGEELPSAKAEAFEPVAAYLMAEQVRSGSLLNSKSVQRLPAADRDSLQDAVTSAVKKIDLPLEILASHPGISGFALQRLLEFFRKYEGTLETLLPPMPGDDDEAYQMKNTFECINDNLSPVFNSEPTQWAAAYTTIDWMHGKPIGYMISGAINRWKNKHSKDEIVPIAKLIRGTMQFVEEFARFKAPKFIAAYLDVLRYYYQEKGQIDNFPDELKMDVYLEFGVTSETMLSLIGIGLSRSSAIELSDFIQRTNLSENDALDYIQKGNWQNVDIPDLVKRDISRAYSERRPDGVIEQPTKSSLIEN